MYAIRSYYEAIGARNGIGLVKLMGRESGFIAAAATLANNEVNFCLIPEVPFSLDVFLKALEKRLRLRGHAVIVVGEGAGQNLFDDNLGADASGNRKLGDIGHLRITSYNVCYTKLLRSKVRIIGKHNGTSSPNWAHH